MDPDAARPSEPPSAPTKDPSLPPVEPPTAGFLLQLFLIPLLIVTIVVLVWLAFSSLAHQGADPHDLARSLRIRNDASWQKAYNLSNMLRDPANQSLKRDVELAGELMDVLERELDAASGLGDSGLRTYRTPEHVRLREFLCKALGEFQLAGVSEVLVRAARQEKVDEDLAVRRKAVEALAVLASNVDRLQEDPRVLEALVEASLDRSPNPEQRLPRGELRAAAAFALGLLGGDDALDRLEAMLGDAYPNARYNAATALARHGDVRCLPTLARMLDPANPEAVDDELSDEARRFKRGEVLGNGIRAVRRLAAANPAADLAEVVDALRRLADGEMSRDVELAAQETLALLRETVSVSAGRSD